MALPQDFWTNEHMFHRFRSKPCQRLLHSGICEWHSQCQFSHDPEWPRRSPSKHNYSPALCPHIRPIMIDKTGEVHLENNCPAGLACRYSHTKDEVLYHPNIFKTSLCEEHRSLTNEQRSARRSKHRPRCHRYYCPFAHGKQELRTSPMTPEQREAVVRAIGVFPNAACCGVCTPNQLGQNCCDNSSGMRYTNSMPMGQQQASVAPWPGSTQPMLSQMVLSGGAHETNTSEITEGQVWGTSPWMQQPLQQQQQQQAVKDMQNLNVSKEMNQILNRQQMDQVQADADDGDLDVDSEIYERAVRFIEELSTEESGSEDHIPIGSIASTTDENIQTPHGIMEPVYNKGTFPPMWNPQEAWVADVNAQDRWQRDHGLNYWAVRSFDLI